MLSIFQLIAIHTDVCSTGLIKPSKSSLGWQKSLCYRFIMIEFRCVVTVTTPAEWLARENIKRLTPRPCINVDYSDGVVYMENRT